MVEKLPFSVDYLHPYPLAAYACDAKASQGRVVPEAESPGRSVFQRDRDRILHSAAFRRLKYKTQVFVYHEGDHYRTRLTHTIEVAQIARTIARNLCLNEDLAEAMALAHDLGHTPFGHAGEEALDRCLRVYGLVFDHNEQTFRILTKLEHRYLAFDGLNLTWECLEGVVKHNGPIMGPHASAKMLAKPEMTSVRDYDREVMPLRLEQWPNAEAQVAALADDIAYNTHDIDDGLRAGLFVIEDLYDVPVVGEVVREIKHRGPDADIHRVIHEIVRRLVDIMVRDLLNETRRRLAGLRPQHVDDIRRHPDAVVAFSPQITEADRALKQFLHQHMYRHYRVNRMIGKAQQVVADLFEFYVQQPQCLPGEWQIGAAAAEPAVIARRVADYVAGMTDRYALEEHRRLFDLYERL